MEKRREEVGRVRKEERRGEGTNDISPLTAARSWRRVQLQEGRGGPSARAQVVCHGFSMRGWTCSSLLPSFFPRGPDGRTDGDGE